MSDLSHLENALGNVAGDGKRWAAAIEAYYTARGLQWPDASEALDWALTELAEAKELLLMQRGGWTRNHPDEAPVFDAQAFAAECGDIIMMALVAGMMAGGDPLSALADKMRRKCGL